MYWGNAGLRDGKLVDRWWRPTPSRRRKRHHQSPQPGAGLCRVLADRDRKDGHPKTTDVDAVCAWS